MKHPSKKFIISIRENETSRFDSIPASPFHVARQRTVAPLLSEPTRTTTMNFRDVDQYATAMQHYFTLFGVTLFLNPDKFWSATAGVMPLRYFNAVGAATTQSGFFARMTGLGFLVLVLGKRLGTSNAVFAKQCNAFHAFTLKMFYDCARVTYARRQTVEFVAQTWKLQVAVNVALLLWGTSTTGGLKNMLKRD